MPYQFLAYYEQVILGTDIDNGYPVTVESFRKSITVEPRVSDQAVIFEIACKSADNLARTIDRVLPNKPHITHTRVKHLELLSEPVAAK